MSTSAPKEGETYIPHCTESRGGEGGEEGGEAKLVQRAPTRPAACNLGNLTADGLIVTLHGMARDQPTKGPSHTERPGPSGRALHGGASRNVILQGSQSKADQLCD